MLSSLSSRISALCAIVVMALGVFGWVLVDASIQTRASFRWATHSATVIETIGDAIINLRSAESGERGFILTRDAAFAQSFPAQIAAARHAIDGVVTLTLDNPVQNIRARQLRLLMAQRAALLESLFLRSRQGQFDQAAHIVAGGRGRDLMAAIVVQADAFLAEEHNLQAERIAAAGRRLDRVKRLAIIGVPTISALVLIVSILIIRGIRRPIDTILKAMTALGRGDRQDRISASMGSREFTQLANGHNRMADRLEAAELASHHSEEELQAAHSELLRSNDILRDRGQAIEILGGMAHRMQAARTEAELADVIRLFVPRVLPGVPGALYAHNNSRNLLIPIASWSGCEQDPTGFAPDTCWALRRGQSHSLSEPGGDIICGHVADQGAIYRCEPLLAGGEVIGTLYLEGLIEADDGFKLTVMAENIASALFNHRLQRGLREQSIRDPLTGLFNRRYLEETLTVEVLRAHRSGQPLSFVMCDVDHFKRFNDEFGHDAGDAVLQAVGAELRTRFRSGDIVCRFGGEEFAIVAPGTSAETLANRVEHARRAITELSVTQTGRTLGSISMSFGIAECAIGDGNAGAILMQSADAALYQAKRGGRNRVVIGARMAA